MQGQESEIDISLVLYIPILIYIVQSYIVQLDVRAAFDRVSRSAWSLIQIEIYWCRWQFAVHL